MKATKETLSPTRVKLTVEVPFDELKPSVDAAYRKIGKQVRVAGFRPGKVPPRILDQRVGRQLIIDEALQQALPQFYTQAVEAEQLDVVSRPQLGVEEFTDGSPLVFTAEVDVRPEIVLPPLEGIEVAVDPVEVTEEHIGARLDAMRALFAVVEPVDRPVRSGDFVTLDMTAELDGVLVEGASATGLSYEVGSKNLVDGLDEAIVDAAAGESRQFDTTLLAGADAGRTARVTVTVGGVKERRLPGIDDDFATTVSEFDTLEELRADIRGQLERDHQVRQVAQAQERLVDILVERLGIPVPESVLEDELAARERRLALELERHGTSREKYIESLGKNIEEFDAETRSDVERAIRTQFLLDAVVTTEKIDITEGDIRDRIVHLAQHSGVSPETFARQLSQNQSQGFTAIIADTVRRKAIRVLLENATFVDTAGNPVELPLARQAPAVAEPGAADAAVGADADAAVGAPAGAAE